ncbi:MAG: hypothetical protein K2X35_21770 [Bryobacteraceae bacterium]|nr:hypothetical protein [Bryobacteraceae bacterium]
MRFLITAVAPALLMAQTGPYPQKIRTFYAPSDPRVPAALMTAEPARLPLPGVQAWATSPGGIQWFGTASGMVRLDPAAPPRDRVQYFASRRYLPDDDVRGILPESGAVWLRTATGVSKIEFRPMTLLQKAAYFERRIAERHDRHGMTADSHLEIAGDLKSNQLVSSDNDGLWTAMYAAAECFRYAVTKEPGALERARRATEAVLFLEQVTGRPGFPARSYIRKGEPKPKDGFWYPAANGDIEWKADTSSDEIVGHFLIFALAHDLLPDAGLKQRIRQTASRIMEHIVSNGYYLIDVTGKPTRWGRWSREYFDTPGGKPDSPLNAAELLMFLKVTHHLTGDAKWDREYRKVAFDLGYAELAARQLELMEELNYSDEELAMLSFYPLLRYEKDAKLLAIYRRAMDAWWKNIQRESNPLWTFIYMAGNPGAKIDLDSAVWVLQRIPLDLIAWDVKNSHRPDVRMATGKDRHGRGEALTFLPPDERPVMKWNGNPFVVDGGSGGRREDDGAFYLLPYWMGRYHGFLK